MDKLTRLKRKAKKEGWANWIRSKADERAVLNGCYFDIKEAEHVKEFFESYLVLVAGRKWAGKAFTLMACQWQDIIAPLFGWMRPDGLRRYQRGYISVAKKNFKTTLCAGILLYMLIGDGEPSAEVYSVANSSEQAGKIFHTMQAMVRASKPLSSMLNVIPTTKRITHQESNSFFRVLSSKPNVAEGVDAHAIIYDELHAATNRELFEALEYAGEAREQPLALTITTAGTDKNSICYEEYERAKEILSGDRTEESYFSYVAEAPIEDPIDEETTWRKANPALGITLDLERFKTACEAAKKTPARLASFRRYRLNQWVECSDTGLFDMAAWDACDLQTDPDDLLGRECWLGLDVSSRVDITALSLLFPFWEEDADEDEDDPVRFDILPFFFIPKEGAKKKEHDDGVPYLTWARQGLIDLTPGNYVDQEAIRIKINELAEIYKIKEIAVDDWNTAKLMVELGEIDGFNVHIYRQGYKSMNIPTKMMEGYVLDKRINHYGNPVLRRMARNTQVEIDPADNYKPSKKKSKERIDGIVATIMGLGHFYVSREARRGYTDGVIEYF